ncbi:Uncharacterized protein TPAR_01200 [Tolypocladium paradoxum]|uniref:Uncharacterized protein n=1 Tax=Tolypocladium paradoxum TaxID=94208 RepID=A0A2S4L834_9HYPO|nr:Uncharacterized protein TPAR_01200 [Tolypocladium paradoxum]
MAFREAGLPLDMIPPHVKPCGPIVLDVVPAEAQDGELAMWLKKASTMLVNLGSGVQYDEQMARAMADALVPVLQSTNAQALWKLSKIGEYSDDLLRPLENYVKSGRLRLETWLNVDPVLLLRTGKETAPVWHANALSEGFMASLTGEEARA